MICRPRMRRDPLPRREVCSTGADGRRPSERHEPHPVTPFPARPQLRHFQVPADGTSGAGIEEALRRMRMAGKVGGPPKHDSRALSDILGG